MDSLNVRRIEIIVKDLLSEFEKESGKLQAEYDDNAARIIEIEENIHNYKENEDTDFQVFSPRKIDNQNEEKIDAMNKEKESIEIANKSLYRQIKYYSEKKEKLNEIIEIIEEDREISIDSVTSENSTSSILSNDIDDDITKVDEKILAYYDSIAGNDESDNYPEEPENIGKEVKSGWRLIKEELDSPIESIFAREKEVQEPDEDEENEEVLKSLQAMTTKLETETKRLEEDYLKTKDEINTVLGDINRVLKKLQK